MGDKSPKNKEKKKKSNIKKKGINLAAGHSQHNHTTT